MQKMPTVFTDLTVQLAADMQHYMETGVAYFIEPCGDYGHKTPHIPAISRVKIFRAASKELGRPFVHAVRFAYGEGNRYSGHDQIQLTLPRAKRLAVLYTGLDLVSDAVARKWRRSDGQITRYATKSTVTYTFKPEHLSVFEGFLEQCRTDPLFRVALKLQ